MEHLIRSFLYNQKQYPIHHLHLTFNKFFTPSTILKQNEFTKIILPYETGFYYQTLTTIKILNQTHFNKYIELLKPYQRNIIGYKLEGILFDKKIENIKDFIYYEQHEKHVDLDYFKNHTGLLSYSEKNKQFMSAIRLFNKDIPLTSNKIEVCYYDAWIDNIELPWKNCINKHYELLKNLQ